MHVSGMTVVLYVRVRHDRCPLCTVDELSNSLPLTEGRPSLVLLRSVQFSSAQFSSAQPFWSIYALGFDIPVTATLDARGYLAWTLLGNFIFLRSLYSKFSSATVL